MNIRKNIKFLKNLNYSILIQWISSHENIFENKLMNQLIKKNHELQKIENTFMSFKFLQRSIKHQLIESWKIQWEKSNKNKNKKYKKFDAISKHQNLNFFSNFEDKLIVIIIMQLKFKHEYFQSFQKILAKWKNQEIFHNEKCSERCNF